MSHTDTIGVEMEIAERLVRDTLGMHVEKAEELSTRSRARTLRLWLTSTKPPAPYSLICKYPFEKTPCAYDEWAGLQFLSEIAGEASISPKFLAGDAQSGLILLQDLGEAQDLSSLQTQGDMDRFRQGCLDLARLVGTLHSCAMGIEDAYSPIRLGLPMADKPVRIRQADALRYAHDPLCKAIAHAGGSVESGFPDELEIVARTIEDPGPFLTFTHGDMAPSNCLFVNGSPFLIDFEWSGYRHALYDALYWHIIYPFPEDLVPRMDRAYRRAFGPACRIALDDTQYRRELAKLCAHHVLSFITWWFPALLEKDSEAVPGVSRRQMILFKLHRLVTLSDGSSLPAIRSVLARFTRELRRV